MPPTRTCFSPAMNTPTSGLLLRTRRKPGPVHGIREIVVGTGGRSHSPLGVPTPNSEVRNWTTYGVLKLTLSRGKYHWEFIPVESQTFHDSGDGVCHKPPATID